MLIATLNRFLLVFVLVSLHAIYTIMVTVKQVEDDNLVSKGAIPEQLKCPQFCFQGQYNCNLTLLVNILVSCKDSLMFKVFRFHGCFF